MIRISNELQMFVQNSKNLNLKIFRDAPNRIESAELQVEYNKQLGLFRKVRPKTPSAVRIIKPKPKRAQSAKQRRSVEKVEPIVKNKYHKLFSNVNIQSIKVFP